MIIRGRPKGSPNKITLTLKTRINLFLERNWDALQDEFDKLEPKEKFGVFKDLLPFVAAKMQHVTTEHEITDKLDALTDQQLDSLITEIIERDEKG